MTNTGRKLLVIGAHSADFVWRCAGATAEFTRVAHADPPPLSRLLAPGAALLIISLLGLLVVGRLGRRAPG